MRCRRCDHRRRFHQHHHAGTYCSQCSCARYAPWWRLWTRDVPERLSLTGHDPERAALRPPTPVTPPRPSSTE